MKSGVHPDVTMCKVTCTCGNSFDIVSEKETMSVDLCSACHPFYTGQQKFVDSAGRVDRFAQRYKMDDESLKALTKGKKAKAGKEKIKHKFNPKARVVEASKDEKGEAKEGGEEAKS